MEYSRFENYVIDALDDCKGAVKQCGKHSITHLNKAWSLREIDKEMAVFRAITAEEEAASALFHSLKALRYNNADKLLFRDHMFKLGLFPFLSSVALFLSELLQSDSSPFESYRLLFTDCNERRALGLQLKIRGENVAANPIPPLNFSAKDGSTASMITFEKYFTRIVEGHNYDNAIKYIKDLAGRRNEVLYANERGRPEVADNIDSFILEQKRKAFIVLSIVLLSDPWHKAEGPGSFIQQSLNSFLLLLGKLQREQAIGDINY